MRILLTVIVLFFSGCGGLGGDDKETGGTTDITCFNSQPVQVLTLPNGMVPDITGDGGITSDIENSDGTHTFTVSGCNFEIIGDVEVTDGSFIKS